MKKTIMFPPNMGKKVTELKSRPSFAGMKTEDDEPMDAPVLEKVKPSEKSKRSRKEVSDGSAE